jgi:phenylalanyl-tRNA synthetase beta subunit
MKISIEWLKDFIEIKETPEELAELLTMHSFETEVESDDVLEVDVPPNRGDCLCHVGIVREIEAIKRAQKILSLKS